MSQDVTEEDIEPTLDKIEEIMAIKGKPNFVSLNKFYTKLVQMVSFVKNLKGIRDMYKYSDIMQARLSNEMKDLEFLLVEMNDILKKINSLKRQKTDISKEVKNLKVTHEKRKIEVCQEMELVAAIYDKDLLRKWHVAKKANDLHTMETFIATLTEKRQVLDYICKMAIDKLSNLKKAQNDTPIKLQALFAKPLPPPLPPPIRLTESEPDTFLNTTD